MPRIASAEFETSAADPSGWPTSLPGGEADGQPPEIAFVGRSNVGKSSLLNALAERKGLARTSGAPGRTRLVNFFRLEILEGAGEYPKRITLRFVDLPGFGYAKVSREERQKWRPAIERYLGSRSSLRAVVLLIDARRVPMKKGDEAEIEDELALAGWIAERGIVVIPTITKGDKLAKHERSIVLERLRKLVTGVPVLVSATSLEGVDRLWGRLIGALEVDKKGAGEGA